MKRNLLLSFESCRMLLTTYVYGNIQKETDTERIFTIIFRGFVISVKSLTASLIKLMNDEVYLHIYDCKSIFLQ